MEPKEIQIDLVKNYLKPTFKKWGYKSKRNTWWKDKGEFYTLINLQNYSWNSERQVDFCFNIGVAIKNGATGIREPNVHDLTIHLREGFYLPEQRKEHFFRNKAGYTLMQGVNRDEFITGFKIDFEEYILPYLEKLSSLKDCLISFGEITFWGERLRNVLTEIETEKNI